MRLWGVNFRFGIPSGNVSGWAGLRGEASFSGGGNTNITKGGCNDASNKSTACITTTNVTLSLIGGGQVMGRFGKWRIELAGATVTGSATLASAYICFECDDSGCNFSGANAAALEPKDSLEIKFSLLGTSYTKQWNPW